MKNRVLTSLRPHAMMMGAAPLIIIGLILFYRFGVTDPADSLWTEDGPIFLNQAYNLGLESIWTPYQGYLHLYQRLFLQLAIQAPLALIPVMLFIGWCVAFIALSYSVVSRARLLGYGFPVAVILLVLIAFQPNGGEVFFSITNTQWILAAALAVYVCVPTLIRPRVAELFAILIASLTGPFSIFLIPVLVLRSVVYRDLKTHWTLYLAIGFAASIQLGILLTSPRMSNFSESEIIVSEWLGAMYKFLTFGSSGRLVVTAAFVFWVSATFALLRPLVQRRKINYPAIFCIFAAVLFFGVSLMSTALWQSVLDISPLGGGARYYFIPYTLLIVGASAAAVDQRVMQGLMLSALVIVCAYSFKPDNRLDLRWAAFSRFAEAKHDVVIPINPQWPQYPGWHVAPIYSRTTITSLPTSLDLSQAEVSNAKVDRIGTELRLRTTNSDPQVLLELDQMCANQRFVGVEIAASRDQAGWAELYWTNVRTFNRENSLKRFYPAGQVAMQFAFERQSGPLRLRFEPMEWVGGASIRQVDVYCLGG